MRSSKSNARLLAAACCLLVSLAGCGTDTEQLDYLPLTVTTKEAEDTLALTDSDSAAENVQTTPTVTVTGEVTTAPQTTTTAPVPQNEAPDAVADEDYLKSSLFIGDSLCSGLASYIDGYTAGENVLTYRDGRTTNMFNVTYTYGTADYELDRAFEEADAEYIYFWIGSNEIADVSAAKFSEELENLIDSVMGEQKSEKKIGLISMAPVGRGYKITPSQVLAYNEAMKTLADKMGENVSYIDIHSVMCDDEGYLLADYDSGDGLHITNKGYRAASAAILAAKML